MKQIPLLQGKALLVELPEGANHLMVCNTNFNGQILKFLVGKLFGGEKNLELPTGNWRIIGMLSELWEGEVSHIFSFNERMTDVESLESAIIAEGFMFQNNLRNPDDVCYFSRDRMIADVREYHEVQSRVLDRSRCLLLGRESN